MNTIIVVLQILSAIPAVQIQGAQPQAPTVAQAGTGTLLIAACPPGAAVMVQPGSLTAISDKEGVAHVKAPAQADGADSYRFIVGGTSVEFHGTLSKGESLSAVCP